MPQSSFSKRIISLNYPKMTNHFPFFCGRVRKKRGCWRVLKKWMSAEWQARLRIVLSSIVRTGGFHTVTIGNYIKYLTSADLKSNPTQCNAAATTKHPDCVYFWTEQVFPENKSLLDNWMRAEPMTTCVSPVKIRGWGLRATDQCSYVRWDKTVCVQILGGIRKILQTVRQTGCRPKDQTSPPATFWAACCSASWVINVCSPESTPGYRGHAADVIPTHYHCKHLTHKTLYSCRIRNCIENTEYLMLTECKNHVTTSQSIFFHY